MTWLPAVSFLDSVGSVGAFGDLAATVPFFSDGLGIADLCV